MATGFSLTGYGPSATNQWQNLTFDGDERKFELWETKILGYMKLKKLKDTIVGTAPVDQEKNETAFAELIQFLDERSLALIMHDAKDDGRKAFHLLRAHYAGSGKPRIITLYNQLTTLCKKDTETITDYILRAETAANALRAVDEIVSDSLLVAMVLKGLPNQFQPFVAVMTQSETVQNFQKFKQALRNFEETEKTRNPKLDGKSSVMKNKDFVRNKITCYNCGISGHKASECRKPKQDRKWCSHCKSGTHIDKECRRQQHKAKKASDDPNGHSFVFTVADEDELFLHTNQDGQFLVDTGATTHIVNRDENFVYVDQSFAPEKHVVELADGSRSNNVAEKKGTVEISLCTSEGKTVKVTLENTLYIPHYPQCIFSVRAATNKGAKVNFVDDWGELITPDGTRFPITQQDRMYYLYKSAVNDTRSETLQTWHKILGHCNAQDITSLEHVVQGMKITAKDKFDCETCILAKQMNTRSREPDIRATKPFELVHTDLAGPIDPVAKDGFRYVIIFTDDYSGCLFTYFLKEKSDAVKATEKFLTDISPYGKVKTLSFFEDVFPAGDVKRMRSDNGGEYIGHEFRDLLLKNRIKHELSAPYSPHQNGTAERNWRTLFEMGRALLIESGLPKFLWTYAIMTATHIRNRCFVKRINNTPYGLVTGVKPNLSLLHVFGTICYPYNNNVRKLDPRCKKGYFVGYDKESPAYLVYYPESKSVMKHRLVQFTDKFDIAHVEHAANELFPDEQINEKAEPTPVANTQPRRNPPRNRKMPAYLDDYIVERDKVDSDNVNIIDYCYMMNTPITYSEATNCDDAAMWMQAMDVEIESLIQNDTFTVTELPEGKRAVDGKWVYAIKGNGKYKARYVAKGYSQIHGLDYFETFSPTARMESVRTLAQLAAQYDLTLHQMDVKGAYLHAPIDSEIYINQPQGYEKEDDKGNRRLVWKLHKSLYGLKQSGRNWHNILHDFLKEEGLVKSNVDPCLFIQERQGEIVILLVWVDDIILAANSDQSLAAIKEKLSKRFNMKDLGTLSMFLGIQFQQNDGFVSMSQSHYIETILEKFGYDDCKPRATPCEINPDVYRNDLSSDKVDPKKYRCAVGSLVYAMTCTRPDLSYVVTKLSQYLSKPEQENWTMVKHVFRYLKGTSNYSLTYRKNPNGLHLLAYCDADWASSLENRHSISGYCVSLSEYGPLISWKSKKQASVALSTCEAEYMSLSAVCQEVSILQQLLIDFQLIQYHQVTVYNVNQGAIALVKNPVKHTRSKHIDIRYHFVREYVDRNNVNLAYVPSDKNIADIFTKPARKMMLRDFTRFLFN